MMKRTKEFDNILNECLERVLIEGEPVERCLADYPKEAAELEPLLQTALGTKRASAVKPRAEFRDRARYQFHRALQEMELKRERRSFFFGWQPRWATAAIAVLVLMLASGGTVAAAGNSMPDEPLYPIKVATETVRLALTPSALGKAELYARLTDERVAEIVDMAEKGKPEHVEKTAERLNSQLIAMANLVKPVDELQDKETTVPMAPAPLAASREAPPTDNESQEKAPPPLLAPAPQPAPHPEAGKESEPPGLARSHKNGDDNDNKDASGDKRTKLKGILARHATEHPHTLREELEKAPESVKPALRRAIELADSGYEEALEALD